MKSQPTTREAPAIRFDPHSLPAPPKNSEFHAPTSLLHGVDASARAVIGGYCLEFLSQYPGARQADIPNLVFELWEHIRDCPIDANRTVDQALRRMEISSGPAALSEVLKSLVGAGDLLRSLTNQRDDLNKLIEQLSAIKAIAK